MDIPFGVGGASNEATMPPLIFDEPSLTSALDFVGNGAFHQFIQCPRTNMRVSFSVAGASNTPAILFCPPSFCSRYVGGPNVELLVRKMGVRLITVDRPGMGGTDRCKTEERLDISCKHAVSVLEYLGIKNVSLLSHSAGAMYMFHLLANYPDVVGPSPRVYMVSGWVPTSISSQFGLQLFPTSLVGTQHNILPALFPVMRGMDSAFSFSSGLMFPNKREKEKQEDEAWVLPDRFRKEGEKYHPKPPFHKKFAAPPEVDKLLYRCAISESLQGTSQDYLLCLGRRGPVNEAWYHKIWEDIARVYGERNDKVTIEAWWGEDDGMIPEKGRKWLDDLIGNAGDAIDYCSVRLEGLAHDGPIFRIEIVGGICEDVRVHGAPTV